MAKSGGWRGIKRHFKDDMQYEVCDFKKSTRILAPKESFEIVENCLIVQICVSPVLLSIDELKNAIGFIESCSGYSM